MKEFGVVFVVRSLKLDYLRPALLDDMLEVTAQIRRSCSCLNDCRACCAGTVC
jgi:acyl-CoA thioesterase FadM